jgi:hypothetical protein
LYFIEDTGFEVVELVGVLFLAHSQSIAQVVLRKAALPPESGIPTRASGFYAHRRS